MGEKKNAIEGELSAAAESAGLFDRVGQGLVMVGGPGAADWLNGMVSNRVEPVSAGRAGEAFVVNRQGRIVTECHYTPLGQGYLLEVPAGMAGSAIGHFQRFIVMEQVTLADVSGQWGRAVLVGPRAGEVLASTAGTAASTAEPGQVTAAEIGGDGCHVVHGSACGLGGAWDVVARAGVAGRVRARLNEAAGVRVIGREAINVLRVEMGVGRFGVDYDARNLPGETGQARMVSFTKGCYVGQEVVARMHSLGSPVHRLMGVLFEGTSAVPPGSELSTDGQSAGRVTSSAVSPRLGSVALAMMLKSAAEPGSSVHANVGAAAVVGRVVPLPPVASAG